MFLFVRFKISSLKECDRCEFATTAVSFQSTNFHLVFSCVHSFLLFMQERRTVPDNRCLPKTHVCHYCRTLRSGTPLCWVLALRHIPKADHNQTGTVGNTTKINAVQKLLQALCYIQSPAVWVLASLPVYIPTNVILTHIFFGCLQQNFGIIVKIYIFKKTKGKLIV